MGSFVTAENKRLKLTHDKEESPSVQAVVDDEFTPVDQVDFIQHCVLLMLQLMLKHKVWVAPNDSGTTTTSVGDALDAVEDCLVDLFAKLDVLLLRYQASTVKSDWITAVECGEAGSTTEDKSNSMELQVHSFFEAEDPVQAAYTAFLNRRASALVK